MHWLFLHAPLALAALASARSFTIDVTSDQVKLHGLGSHTMANCYWDGTSPFCAGSCDTSNGWVECDKSGSGDGATCVTGYKKKCCKESCSSNVHTGGHVAHTRGDEPHDDYCDKGYIIVCPPGAKSNHECRCIEDPGDTNHGGGHYETLNEI